MRKLHFLLLLALSTAAIGQNTGSLPYWSVLTKTSSISCSDSIAYFNSGVYKKSSVARFPVNGALIGLVTFNNQTASYTLGLSDFTNFKQIRINSASASNLTVPPNSSVAFPVGAQILVKRIGAGATTIVQGAGVTVTPSSGVLTDAGQYALMTLIKTGTDTWDLENGSGAQVVSYTPTLTGFSTSPTILAAQYVLIGKLCTVTITLSGTGGVSNADSFTLTLPFAASSTASQFGFAAVVDNSVAQTLPGLLRTRTGSNILDIYKDRTTTALWTISANYKAASFVFTYIIQ